MALPTSSRFVVRPEIQATGFYLHVEDMAGGVTGPFPDAAAAYYVECRERGDGTAFTAVYPGSSPLLNDALDEGALLSTIGEDRESAAKFRADPSSSSIPLPAP